mgnify:CR=1 FL=1
MGTFFIVVCIFLCAALIAISYGRIREKACLRRFRDSEAVRNKNLQINKRWLIRIFTEYRGFNVAIGAPIHGRKKKLLLEVFIKRSTPISINFLPGMPMSIRVDKKNNGLWIGGLCEINPSLGLTNFDSVLEKIEFQQPE